MKPGEVVAGRYRLEQKLGMGGMGTVWSAQHTQTGRSFALKIMHSTVAANEDSRQRFLKEAKASARIDHPNVIDVLDVGELPEGQLFMAMELLEGLSLADALRLEPALSVRELLVVLRETCAALAAAHAVGIVHRDVKPANVFLHRDRTTGVVRPKILDFGVSKFAFLEESATHTGSLLGSPRYMSPEQARSAAQADARSDVWSIGVILFEALSGTFPHEGESFSNLVVAIATQPPRSLEDVAPAVPRALASLIDQCLRPRDERLPSCEALVMRIDDLLLTHDLAHVPCVRGRTKKAIPRPGDLVIRSISAPPGWREDATRAMGGAAAPVPRAPTPLFDLPSSTTNRLIDDGSSSSRTGEITRPVAVARVAPDRAKTTPMAPSPNEIAALLARIAPATGPHGTMRVDGDPGAASRLAPALSPAASAAGDQTQIHARPSPRPAAAAPAPEAATRLITLPDRASPSGSPVGHGGGGDAAVLSAPPYAPAPAPFEPRDHLVESVSAFGVERHRAGSSLPSGAPPDAGPSPRRHAGAAIAVATAVLLALVTVLVVAMGRGVRDPANASPAAPTASFLRVVAAAPGEPSPEVLDDEGAEPSSTASGDAEAAVEAPPSAAASTITSAATGAAPAAPSATASATTAPPGSASAPKPKLGPPWPGGVAPRPTSGTCAPGSPGCLGSGR